MEPKKDIFKHLKARSITTPDQTYFEELTQKILASQQPKVIPLYQRPILWIGAVAASILVFILFNINTPETGTNVLLALDTMPTEDIYNYIEEHIDDFETDMLCELIPTNHIEEIQLTPSPKEIIISEPPKETVLNFDNINHQDILDYLNSEEIDIQDLQESESQF